MSVKKLLKTFAKHFYGCSESQCKFLLMRLGDKTIIKKKFLEATNFIKNYRWFFLKKQRISK